MMGSMPMAIPNGAAASGTETVPHAGYALAGPRSTPLPRLDQAQHKQPSIGLLIAVAVAFLVVGALLAALVMMLIMR